MKTSQKYSVGLAAALLLLGASVAHATNITINDNNLGNTGNPEQATGWYKGGTFFPGALAPLSEYEEVEPGMQISQGWDLAAFVNPTPGVLGVVSGYDLKNGFGGTTIGDIFVSLDPSSLNGYADPGTPYPQFTTNATFGYDFAIKFDFSTPAPTYKVIKLDANTQLENGEYFSNPNNYNSASNPWRVASYSANDVIYSANLTYTDSMSEAAASALTGYSVNGYYKYYAELSTNWLAPFLSATNPQVLYKLTMECGNDNMLGLQTAGFNQVPDGSATLALLGLSFLGLVGAAKLKGRKAA